MNSVSVSAGIAADALARAERAQGELVRIRVEAERAVRLAVAARNQTIMQALAAGNQGKTIALRLGIDPGRISQIKGEYGIDNEKQFPRSSG